MLHDCVCHSRRGPWEPLSVSFALEGLFGKPYSEVEQALDIESRVLGS